MKLIKKLAIDNTASYRGGTIHTYAEEYSSDEVTAAFEAGFRRALEMAAIRSRRIQLGDTELSGPADKLILAISEE